MRKKKNFRKVLIALSALGIIASIAVSSVLACIKSFAVTDYDGNGICTLDEQERYCEEVYGCTLEELPEQEGLKTYSAEEMAEALEDGTAQASSVYSDSSTSSSGSSAASSTAASGSTTSGSSTSTSTSKKTTVDTTKEKAKVVTYTVSYTVNDKTMGTVSSANETVQKGKDSVGSTATANDGYTFTGWTNKDGKEMSVKATYAPTKISADSTYTANFEKTEYTVTYKAGDDSMGTVSSASEVGTTDTEFAGSTATASDGYMFVSWVDADGNSISTDALYVPSDISADVTYTAIFKAMDTFTVSYKVSDDTMGTVSVTSETVREDGVVTTNDSGTFTGSTATANKGYEFTGWEKSDGTVISTDATFVPSVIDNATYTAVFEKHIPWMLYIFSLIGIFVVALVISIIHHKKLSDKETKESEDKESKVKEDETEIDGIQENEENEENQENKDE